MPFTATLMKGRSNYLCLHRWEIYRDGVEGDTSSRRPPDRTGDRVLLPIIDDWAATTDDGDRAELRDLPEDLPLWKDDRRRRRHVPRHRVSALRRLLRHADAPARAPNPTS